MFQIFMRKIILVIRQYKQMKKRTNEIININNNNQICIIIKIFVIFVRIKLFWELRQQKHNKLSLLKMVGENFKKITLSDAKNLRQGRTFRQKRLLSCRKGVKRPLIRHKISKQQECSNNEELWFVF